MTYAEPILRDEDRNAWDSLMLAVEAHAQSAGYRRRVDQAHRLAAHAISIEPNACVMWSGGKDSTALVHLVCVDLAARIPVYSEKDNLDYPSEEEYVTALAVRWGLDLRILRPEVSPAGWMAEHGHELMGSSDLHSRAAGLSKACFYNLVEGATAHHGLTFLGLRAAESHGRAMNLYTHGQLYRKRNGQMVATPLARWTGLDVYAYLSQHNIDPLPVYRCIAFMHAGEPWRIRKSWWVPGSSARHGGTAWLRHYYPSLFHRLCGWIPNSRTLA